MTHETPADARNAITSTQPGFHFRPPPDPHNLDTFITPDASLFQTIHMGAAVIDPSLWRLDIHGLVASPFSLTFPELLAFPAVKVTAFHECYGSPLKPPTEFVRRIGNVTWTGVRLRDLLIRAGLLPDAAFVWSDGLDSGTFGGITADRYRKDLPLSKALSSEVLVAYEINGRPLDVRRGGPVRLVVPGWFGTNSAKWLCRLRVESGRATGHFTTTFYNELVPGTEMLKPVWEVEPSSIIVRPKPGEVIESNEIEVWGWAWSGGGVQRVDISVDGGATWIPSQLEERREFEWQRFSVELRMNCGRQEIVARATSFKGVQQPMANRRSHVHTVSINIGSPG